MLSWWAGNRYLIGLGSSDENTNGDERAMRQPDRNFPQQTGRMSFWGCCLQCQRVIHANAHEDERRSYQYLTWPPAAGSSPPFWFGLCREGGGGPFAEEISQSQLQTPTNTRKMCGYGSHVSNIGSSVKACQGIRREWTRMGNERPLDERFEVPLWAGSEPLKCPTTTKITTTITMMRAQQWACLLSYFPCHTSLASHPMGSSLTRASEMIGLGSQPGDTDAGPPQRV